MDFPRRGRGARLRRMSFKARLLLLMALLLLLAALLYFAAFAPLGAVKEVPQSAILESLEPMEVMIVFTKARGKTELQQKFGHCLSSLLRHSTGPMMLSIVGDSDSRVIAYHIFQRLKPRKNIERLQLTGVDMEAVGRKVGELVSPLVHYFRHSPDSYYGDTLFFLSLIAHRLFPDKQRLVLLDSDLSFRFRTPTSWTLMTSRRVSLAPRRDVRELWDQFTQFTGSEIIGLAREAQPVYRHVFRDYRHRHPGTKIGDPPPDGITGFNSGVLLLHLEKMRRKRECADSGAYSGLLRVERVEELVARYGFKGHLGDQDFYTLASVSTISHRAKIALTCVTHSGNIPKSELEQVEEGGLFHELGCEWNRQLCTWWRDHGYADVFDAYYACDREIAIYHGNCNSPIPSGE